MPPPDPAKRLNKHALLAVDAGLRTGFALFDEQGRLIRYGSRHFGSRNRLKAAVYRILRQPPAPSHMVIEGGGPIADVWVRECLRLPIQLLRVSAEEWRKVFFAPRHRRSGRIAKERAVRLAREVIQTRATSRATSLRHDAAEAILIGLWGLERFEWPEGGVPRKPHATWPGRRGQPGSRPPG